jgi:cation diffusion facilitator CzcD-associated flavoprotein CzcO
MSFSDKPFPYGPFVPHWVPKQYIENYFSWHKIDQCLVLNTTVEDVASIPAKDEGYNRWKLTLRRYDPIRKSDDWWEEVFDAVILANGHYSVPIVSALISISCANSLGLTTRYHKIPEVPGLTDYMKQYPGRVSHSKSYRRSDLFSNKRVLVIGNSASGHDITTQLVQSGKPRMPVYQSRRSKSRWDGPKSPKDVEW